jgi:dihydroorotase
MALTRFPGFIDIHVHLRDPGQTHKEDFRTGTRAALAGGFTFLCDMPNNTTPTFTPEALQEKLRLAKEKAVCDIGFHYGTDGTNLSTFTAAWSNPHVFGLKIYCNQTTGGYQIADPAVIDACIAAWDSHKPILVHAEGEMLALCIERAKKYGRRLHVCHVSRASEVAMIRKAKESGMSVSAGVTPHHLFLDTGVMKPGLSGIEDKKVLLDALIDGTIDLVESDHAPHTREEKDRSTPSYGVPGLETTVGLLLKAAKEHGWKTVRIVDWLYTQPKEFFQIPDQPDTFVELDPDAPYIVGANGYQTKSGWSPFDGWELYGQVRHVIYRGREVMKEGVLTI